MGRVGRRIDGPNWAPNWVDRNLFWWPEVEPRFGRGIWARRNRAGHSSTNLGAGFRRGFGRAFWRGFRREIRALFRSVKPSLRPSRCWFLASVTEPLLGIRCWYPCHHNSRSNCLTYSYLRRRLYPCHRSHPPNIYYRTFATFEGTLC